MVVVVVDDTVADVASVPRLRSLRMVGARPAGPTRNAVIVAVSIELMTRRDTKLGTTRTWTGAPGRGKYPNSSTATTKVMVIVYANGVAPMVASECSFFGD